MYSILTTRSGFVRHRRLQLSYKRDILTPVSRTESVRNKRTRFDSTERLHMMIFIINICSLPVIKCILITKLRSLISSL